MSDAKSIDLDQWHQRYLQQTQWTKEIRKHIFTQAHIKPGSKLLEVGSGTGALLSQIIDDGCYSLSGIDIDHNSLQFSRQLNKPFLLTQADGYHLPFAGKTFAVAICHYLLLWVKNPIHILREMYRVTQSGGCVIALAEPDHQARIDFPAPLDSLGKLQTKALESQGADTAMGRKVRQLFHTSGLQDIQTGILGAQWPGKSKHAADDIEWMTLLSDLAGQLPEAQLSKFKLIDQEAQESGKRVLFIPTFYALGFVP